MLPVEALSDELLFFVGCTARTGCELWASDGTRLGTRLVKDFTPEAGDSYLRLWAAGGKVFILWGQSQTTSLWASDGTAAAGFRMAS